jgi:hypothetical protein
MGCYLEPQARHDLKSHGGAMRDPSSPQTEAEAFSLFSSYTKSE